MLPTVSPIPIKERLSMVFVEKGQLDVLDGSFVVVDSKGTRTHIPVGGVLCILLEPGARISHSAVCLASKVGTLIIWVGEAGVRLYSAGQPGGARADKLLYQASLALNDEARRKVAREMFFFRFGQKPSDKYTIEQLRGIEGGRVKILYQQIAKRYGVIWKGRKYDPNNFESGDKVNRCLSSATSCLYGVCEAAILAAGYSPAIGFVHSGKPRSFVFDIADLFKFETVVPVAFNIASKQPHDSEGEVRRACRDSFRSSKLLKRIIPTIEEVLQAGGLAVPNSPDYTVPPAFIKKKGLADVGHRC